MKTVVYTVDVEPDVQPFSRGTAYGLEEGLPALFDLLEEVSVSADFFFLGSSLGQAAWAARKARALGHGIGSHGWSHEFLCEMDGARQLREIDEATSAIEHVSGESPIMFRAADFSISGFALEHLARAGYIIDSSVMPERYARRWRLFKVYDHRGAPLRPYRPSRDPRRPGEVPILEMPVAVNLSRPGTPLGTAFLNTFGIDRTVNAIRTYPEDIIVLLTHPWELVDLGQLVAGLPQGYTSGCSSDLEMLKKFFHRLQGKVKLSTLGAVRDEWNGGRS
jgi:peptidoglycan/xylan/chitin deacetylase (PgdA/CDA1 family)